MSSRFLVTFHLGYYDNNFASKVCLTISIIAIYDYNYIIAKYDYNYQEKCLEFKIQNNKFNFKILFQQTIL